jgi:hypothetical protein
MIGYCFTTFTLLSFTIKTKKSKICIFLPVFFINFLSIFCFFRCILGFSFLKRKLIFTFNTFDDISNSVNKYSINLFHSVLSKNILDNKNNLPIVDNKEFLSHIQQMGKDTYIFLLHWYINFLNICPYMPYK